MLGLGVRVNGFVAEITGVCSRNLVFRLWVVLGSWICVILTTLLEYYIWRYRYSWSWYQNIWFLREPLNLFLLCNVEPLVCENECWILKFYNDVWFPCIRLLLWIWNVEWISFHINVDIILHEVSVSLPPFQEEMVNEFNENAVDPLTVSLYQMDLDRTMFLLRSYLRTRLQKVTAAFTWVLSGYLMIVYHCLEIFILEGFE